MKPAGDLFIVSSPSGAGKTTLILDVLKKPPRGEPIHFSVSHTTRQPRPGERDGVEYYFVSEDAFKELRERDGFLEWAEVHGHLYGTSRHEVEPRLSRGEDVILDIDVQGARKVRGAKPDAVPIFVFPPSLADLERRLRSRASDSPETVERRLRAAPEEMRQGLAYDYAIINDDLGAAVDELRSIIVARRAGRIRRRERLESILRTFQQ